MDLSDEQKLVKFCGKISKEGNTPKNYLIGMNLRYTESILEGCESEKIRIYFNKPTDPIIIKEIPDDPENYVDNVILQMPIRL